MVNTKVDIKQFATEEGKTWINELLHDENIENLCITFTKKDGTERQMHCTLSESRIPTDKQPKTQQSASDSGSALRVFDTDKGEWRSFRWDSIKNVTFTIGEKND